MSTIITDNPYTFTVEDNMSINAVFEDATLALGSIYNNWGTSSTSNFTYYLKVKHNSTSTNIASLECWGAYQDPYNYSYHSGTVSLKKLVDSSFVIYPGDVITCTNTNNTIWLKAGTNSAISFSGTNGYTIPSSWAGTTLKIQWAGNSWSH